MKPLAAALALIALATPQTATARACVTAGTEIRHRQHITCAHAIKVARRYRATFTSPTGWSCGHGREGAWRGYCEKGRMYFDWRPS